MNFLGFAFPLALLVAVQLTTFTWAATNVTKTSGKDYIEQGQHLSEQPVRRIVQKCIFKHFSLGGRKPLFPMPKGVTFKSICPDNQYATFYNNDWGIARYSLYKITAAQATTVPVPRPKGDPWQPNQTPGIHQGSEVLYRNQPIQGRYERGHVVPVNILRYSDESARATFTYTNCVPQIGNFNKGQWKKYEGKIVEYARGYCAPEGGTLYLITGTSQVKFEEILNLQGQITGVDKSVKPMEWFHDNVNIYPALGPKIAIPNSMWTVGCCWKDNYGVVGAFGVMGDNSLNPSMNEFMMSTQTVGYVEKVLRLEHPNLKLELFPGVKGKNCYKQGKNVPLANL